MGLNLPFRVLKLYSTLWMRAHARVVVKGQDELPPRSKAEKRVYLLLNHTTSFDVAALLHLSKEPFATLMEEDTFSLPLVGKLLKAAGFVSLNRQNSKPAVDQCMEKVQEGLPLLISLQDGLEADTGKPSTGGIRIAHLTGATLIPIFLHVEKDRLASKFFRTPTGVLVPYTTFKNSFYFVEFLKPVDLSSLPKVASHDDYLKVAKTLAEKLASVQARYDSFLSENRERFAPMKRSGGARYRIAW